MNREMASHGAQLAQLTRWRRDQGPSRSSPGDGSVTATSSTIHQGNGAPSSAWLAEVRVGVRAAEDQSAAAEDANRELHDKLADVEGRVARQVADGVEQLRSEMGRTLKVSQRDTARFEGALEAE